MRSRLSIELAWPGSFGFAHPGKARRHLCPLAIDVMAGQEAHRFQDGRDGLAVELLRLDLGDEGGRAELMADVAGRHVRRASGSIAARQQDRRSAEQKK